MNTKIPLDPKDSAPVMEYKLICSYDTIDFSKDIQGYLADGWRLHGDTKIVHTMDKTNRLLYFQALVR